MNSPCSRADKVKLVSQSKLQTQKCRTCNGPTAMRQKTTTAHLLPTELRAAKTSKTHENYGILALDSSLACTISSCSHSKAQSRQHQILRFLHQGSLISVSSGRADSPLSTVFQFQTCKGSGCQAGLHKKRLRYNTCNTLLQALHSVLYISITPSII